MTTKTLLAVDGNSLLHRSFHALLSSGLTTRDGRPTWAVKGFMSLLLGAVDRTRADAVVVGFDDHSLNIRKVAYPPYKATRSPKPPELALQIAMAIEVLREAGVHVVVSPGLEADDVMASAAAFAPTKGWRTTLVTSDRDSFALIDEHTSLLRLITGGIDASPILTPDRLHAMLDVAPHQYTEYAAMRGDTSDNLAGIRGIGKVSAAKLLAAFGSVQAAFADADAGGELVVKALGKSFVAKLSDPESRAAFTRNIEIMTMHRDVDLALDLDQPGAGLLPLAPARVTAALEGLELTSLLTYATRALCGARTATETQVPQPPAGFDEIPLSDEIPWDEPMREVRTPEPVSALAGLVTSGAMRGSTAPRPSTWDDF